MMQHFWRFEALLTCVIFRSSLLQVVNNCATICILHKQVLANNFAGVESGLNGVHWLSQTSLAQAPDNIQKNSLTCVTSFIAGGICEHSLGSTTALLPSKKVADSLLIIVRETVCTLGVHFGSASINQ